MNKAILESKSALVLCRRCYHIMTKAKLPLDRYDNKSCVLQTVNNHVIIKRSITYNEGLAIRGDSDYYATGFALEKGLKDYGTFNGMEEFMTDNLPDFVVSAIPILPKISITTPWPTIIIGHGFDNLQYITGLPWFATIALFGIVVKVGLYPFHIWWRKDFQNHIQQIPCQLGAFLQTYFSNIFKSGSVESMYKAYDARDKICADMNIPKCPSLVPLYATTLLPAVSLLGLAYLTNLTYGPLLTGGIFWFQNLAEPDPYLILPVINSVLIICNARLHPIGSMLPWPVLSYGFKFQSPLVVLTCLQIWFSSAFMIYCISANSVGLIMQLLLRTELVRAYHGLQNIETILVPLFKQSNVFHQIGDQIGDTKKQLIESIVAQEKLLNEPQDKNTEGCLPQPEKKTSAS